MKNRADADKLQFGTPGIRTQSSFLLTLAVLLILSHT